MLTMRVWRLVEVLNLLTLFNIPLESAREQFPPYDDFVKIFGSCKGSRRRQREGGAGQVGILEASSGQVFCKVLASQEAKAMLRRSCKTSEFITSPAESIHQHSPGCGSFLVGSSVCGL